MADASPPPDSLTAAAASPAWTPPRPDPQPRPLPIPRLIRSMGRDMLSTWPEEAFREPWTRRDMLGAATLLVNDPAVLRRVLVDNAPNYVKTVIARRLLEPGVGRGLLLAEGADWQRRRRLLAPSFTPRTIAALAPAFAAATESMLETWGPPEVDAYAAMQLLALDIAARTMFSLSLGERAERLAAMVQEYQHKVGRPGLADILAAGGLNPLPDFRRAGFRRRWTALIDGLVAERRSAGVDPARAKDVLDLLLEARDPDTGEGLTPEEVRDEVATLIAAGFETTAMGLWWALYLLGCDPVAQERARAEAQAAAGAAPDDLSGLPYVRAVVQEAMRLYPPAHAFSRRAVEADRVGALEIPAGTNVIVSPYVLHRHRTLWREPDRFLPERFLPGSDEANRPFTWLPFSTGPRVCIGMQFALVESVTAVALILRRFRLTVPDPAAVRPVGKVTTMPVGDTRVRVEAV